MIKSVAITNPTIVPATALPRAAPTNSGTINAAASRQLRSSKLKIKARFASRTCSSFVVLRAAIRVIFC